MLYSSNDVTVLKIAAHTAESAPSTGTHAITNDSAFAEADVTFTLNPAPGNTITIGAAELGGPTIVFTATAGAPGTNEFQIGATTTDTANNFEAAVEASTLVTGGYVTSANNVANVNTIISAWQGRAGNRITLSRVGANITLESATLTGGAGGAVEGDTATIGATVFTWKYPANVTLSTHVAIRATAELTAAELELRVEAHTTSGALVTGSTSGLIVTWTSIAEDTSGNAIALAEAGDSSTVSGAFMTGGIDPLIAAPASGRRIVVLDMALTLDAAGEVTWKSNNTALTGAMELLADTPLVVAHEYGVLACATAEQLNLLATQAANGHIAYVVIKA